MNQVLKRFISLALVLLMTLMLLPTDILSVTAYAEDTANAVSGLADPDIGLSFTVSSNDANYSWDASCTTITGSTTSKAGTCSDTSYNTTLTITNKRATAATLFFNYTIVQSSGTIQVAGNSVTANSEYSGEIASGESIKVCLKSGSPSTATTITLTNIALVADVDAAATFLPAENGSYTVNGTAVAEETSYTQNSLTAYTVAATPDSGYQFMGWYNLTTQKYISTDASTDLRIDGDCSITARFGAAGVALFETGGQIFEALDEAVTYAQENNQTKIILASNGTIQGNYTIPAGITLLIPFNTDGTCYTTNPSSIYTNSDSVSSVKTCFRKLTLTSASSLTVYGVISVGGRYHAAAGSASGYMTGAYGQIQLSDGSSITVKSGGTLYAWGFISGHGSVTVESGGSVYEWFQIADFRGGGASSGMASGPVFPFSQYYVQNIETPLILYSGATETVSSGVYVNNKVYATAIAFIGDDGMFKVASGSLTKDYDEATDRLAFTINGDAELSTLALDLAGTSFNSGSFDLPLNNNISINIESGKVTINQTAALLAGVEVNIADGADLTVADGKKLYVYDADEWTAKNYVGQGSKFISVRFAPGKGYTRQLSDLKDAKIDVGGSLTAIGEIYTTAGGADICSSSGTGVFIQQGAPGTDETTKQVTQVESNTSVETIPITSAKLHNADGTYTETTAASAGDTINYVNGFWGGEAWSVIFHANYEKDGAPVDNVYKQEIADFTGAKLDTIETIQKETATGGVSPFNRDGEYQLFVGWGKSGTAEKADLADGAEITEDIFKADEGEKYNSSIDLYALWKQAVEVSFDANGGTGAMDSVVYNIVNGEVPAADNSLPACTFTKDGCMFTGWAFSVDSGTDDLFDEDHFKLTADQLKEKGIHITLYANWADAVTVTYNANDGTGTMDAQTVKKGTEVTISANTFTREGYTFTGWNTVADGTGTPYADKAKVALTENITLYAQWTCAHGETEVRDAKAATCTEKGYTGDTYCKTCGEKIADGKEIPATGHKEVIDPAVEATCTTPGKTEGKHCSVCNEVLVAQKEIPAKGHSWDEGKVTTAATCTVDGVKTYTCTVCNETKTEAISATGHTSVDVPEKPATCTEAGYEAGTKCAVCGATISGMTVIPAKGHVTVTDPAVEATCTKPGKTEGKHCSVCDEVLVAQKEIPAKGHTEVTDPAVEATCTETGKTEGKHCSICNEVLVAQTVIPAKGHTKEIRNAKEATTSEDGYTGDTYCSVCNTLLEKGEDIPRTGVKITWKITWPSSGETTSEDVYVEKGSIPAYPNTESLVEVTVERTYTFDHWEPKPTAAEQDTTYTAVFNESTTKHKVTWVIDAENNISKVQYFDYGTTPTYTGTPSKDPTETTVYTFTGWNPVPEKIEDARERKYTAQYKEETRFFTITVVRAENDSDVIKGLQYSDTIDRSKFNYGERDGYTFDGWTVTGENGTTYAEIPETMPAENLTLTAKWKSNEYSLKFMDNDTEVEGSGTYSHGDTVTAPTLTNEGWTFNGWVDGDGKLVYGPGVKFSASKDLTLYASWTQKEYRIIYMVNGEEVHRSGVKHFGDTISNDDKYTGTPELTGHTFRGWYDNSDCTGDEYIYPDTMPASDIVLYAKMTPNTYKATFYVDNELYDEADVIYGQPIPAPAKDPYKEGYRFTGWNADLTHMPDKDIRIDAQFSADKFAVTLKVNGDTWRTVEVLCGAEINSYIEAFVPELEGYTFTGWDGIPTDGLMPARNIELNAIFEINTYTITVHGRINDSETYSVMYGADIADVNIRADKTGYTFKGWYSDAEYTKSYTLPGTMPAENIDLYGLWTVNKYTISFNGNGGPTPESITADYNSTITLPSPSRTGYTFGGWYIGETTRFESNTMPAENLILTAKWIPDMCLIIWNNYDGTELTRENAAYDSTLQYTGVTPKRPDDGGYSYTFAGWKDASGNILADGATVSGEAVYTAYYTATAKTFKLVLDYGDGSDSRESNVTFGSVIDVEDPARADYVFDGWVDSSDTKYPTLAASANVTMPAHDLSVVAQWKNAEYKLTLLTDDSSAYISEGINVPWGSLLKSYIPAQESKPGYTLEWRTGALGGGEAIDLDGYVMPKAALTLYAHYSANDIALTFNYKDADYEDASASITSKCDAAIDVPVIPTEISISAKQLDGASYTGVFKFTGWSPELPNKTPAQGTKYTAQYVFTGWLDDANGRTYLADGKKAAPGWKQIDGAWYYFDKSSYVVKGLSGEIPAQDGSAATGRYLFDENTGSFKSDHTGPINDGSAIYWVENGKVNVNAGLQRYSNNGTIEYYYFITQNDIDTPDSYYVENFNGYSAADIGKAVTNKGIGDAHRFWLSKGKSNPGWIPDYAWYVIGEDGIFTHDADTTKNGICMDESGVKYYYVDGVKSGMGLFYDQATAAYYYASMTTGVIVCNRSYWVTKTNDLMAQGSYDFDADGKMIRTVIDDKFTGIDKSGDTWYYYVNGAKTYAGLIMIGGEYYYVKTDCSVVRGQTYYISKTNGLKPAGSYEFNADGTMVVKDYNGIVSENGSMYYYVNGVKTYAGLIVIDGNYYYVKTDGEGVHGKAYRITKTNGLLDADIYTFDDDGKLVGKTPSTTPEPVDPAEKDGIVKENGSMYYYVNGVKTYAGLIVIDGSYYYVNSNCEVIHGRSYRISRTNGLMPAGTYDFDADGRMSVPDASKNGIVKEGDIWYYYVDGAKTYAGLIKIDDSYYYVKSNCEVVHDRTYYISKTNGLMPAGTYTFGADGKMVVE